MKPIRVHCQVKMQNIVPVPDSISSIILWVEMEANSGETREIIVNLGRGNNNNSKIMLEIIFKIPEAQDREIRANLQGK